MKTVGKEIKTAIGR